jgi:hypothetical protein
MTHFLRDEHKPNLANWKYVLVWRPAMSAASRAYRPPIIRVGMMAHRTCSPVQNQWQSFPYHWRNVAWPLQSDKRKINPCHLFPFMPNFCRGRELEK